MNTKEEKVLNKRKLKRRHLIYYLRVFDRNSGQLIGHLVDVTTEGVMLISKHPIETNTIFKSKMVLPKGIEGSKEITFDAKSIWCKKDVNPNFYATGFQLLKSSPEDIKLLERLIDEFGFRD